MRIFRAIAIAFLLASLVWASVLFNLFDAL
jgi:hypothetical protein